MTENKTIHGCRSAVHRGALPAILAIAASAAASRRAAAEIPLNYLGASGKRASEILPLTYGVIAISCAVIVIIAGLLLWAILRRRTGPDRRTFDNTPPERSGSGLQWIGWGVGISTLVLCGSVVWTVATLSAVIDPGKDPPITLEVTGYQWWWDVHYVGDMPSQGFSTANEIHIPVGEPVRIRLVGTDVIHSFWVPALSGKVDVIPGRTNETWLQADRPGTYRGQCTEYCGVQHAKMGFLVIAQPPDEFEAWRQAQLRPASEPASPMAQQGQRQFQARCAPCHTVRGTGAGGRVGPDLTHLASRQTLAAATLRNTPEQLAYWVTHTQQVKPGNRMPDIDMGERQLAELTAYLETLE